MLSFFSGRPIFSLEASPVHQQLMTLSASLSLSLSVDRHQQKMVSVTFYSFFHIGFWLKISPHWSNSYLMSLSLSLFLSHFLSLSLASQQRRVHGAGHAVSFSTFINIFLLPQKLNNFNLFLGSQSQNFFFFVSFEWTK